jgi:REP element-mobilizing transposase RayT
MARKPRIEFPGALYHVIARGNQRRRTFFNPEDYENYLSRLWSYHEKFHFTLYAHCLMPNHIHLLIESAEVPLSKIMQAIQFSYTQSFNRRHKKVGHLFQGRYKAVLCQKDEYLLELVRYIHLNPVRAGIVKDPKNYNPNSTLFQPDPISHHIGNLEGARTYNLKTKRPPSRFAKAAMLFSNLLYYSMFQ